jgi:N-carbamoyl-L-amino-acid hydrolase
MGEAPAIDAGRVIGDLRELARRTSDERGAQRVCWTPAWREARSFLGDLLAELGLAPELDEAGNLWARLEGADPGAEAVVVGSHVDSVPDGGWLDGALGVMAGIGVLRAWAGSDGPPPRPLVLVDWADEEGARFGRSLFGSSAFSGTLDPAALLDLADAEGSRMAEVLSTNGVELARAGDAAARREGLGAYLELHIEQGPRMEAEGLRAAAVTGCVGIERARFAFAGQASHAGTTPMEMRRDAGLAAAEAMLAVEQIPRSEDGVATAGELRLEPGIVTAIAGRATLGVDLRHPEPDALERMLGAARSACREAAEGRGCELTETRVWGIEPTLFDTGLVFAARRACERVAGEAASMTSGALHDAAEVARVLPAVMVFAPSTGGISHAPEEDTPEPDLAVAIEAFAALAAQALARGSQRG